MTASDRIQNLIRQGTDQRQSPAYPTLILAQKAGDFILRKPIPLVKLSNQRGLLQGLPTSLLLSDQGLKQGLRLPAKPDFGQDRVFSRTSQSFHPQITVHQHMAWRVRRHHTDRPDLAPFFQGAHQRQQRIRLFDPSMGVAKIQLSDLQRYYMAEIRHARSS
jgi:hypothetical protein